MSRIAYASRMTPARLGGRAVALAVLMVVLFLTFLDNTVVSVALGSAACSQRCMPA